jgi:purine nucleosidase
MRATPTKILFDTDPGIDDAMALLMLARDPRAQLLGISTVFGNASIDTTTANALALCERFGISVPVARGAARALVVPPAAVPHEIHGRDGLGNVNLPAAQRHAPIPTPAARFISDTARAHRGELVLVAVGPLTNIAQALQLDPELPKHVRHLVVMGGAFGTQGHQGNVTPWAEANIYCDPHAASAVLAADWPVTLVGLDVTHQVLMRTDYLNRLGDEGGDEGRFIRQMTQVYERFYHPRTGGGIYSHDASAVACALDASAFELHRADVLVDLSEGVRLGQTTWSSPEAGQASAGGAQALSRQRVRSCTGVDAQQLLAEFRSVFVR